MKKLFKQAVAILLIVLYWQVIFAAQPKKLIVVLDWFVNPDHAPLMVALQEGFFAKYGLEVKFISPADITSGEKMVAANRADIAVTYQPALVRHVTRGLPLMRFATLINAPLNCLIVLQDGKINSMQDLKGKRIGHSSPGVNTIMLTSMLKTANLTVDDVRLITVKFNHVQALLGGKIDGFVGGMRNFTPLAIKFSGKAVKVFYPERYGFPEYDELILVANKNKIDEPALAKFTHALRDGIKYLKKNPQKSWQKFAANHPELNNGLNQEAWFATLPYFANDPVKLDKIRYQKLARFLWDNGLIKYLPNIEEYAK